MNMRDLYEDPPPSERKEFPAVKCHPNVPGQYAGGADAAQAMLRGEPVTLRFTGCPDPGTVLRFAGGTVDTTGMRASGPTRTTLSTDTMIGELRDAIAFLEDAKRLDEQGRSDEGDFERRMAARHIRNALLWCEP